ncbi:hypothetical protein U1Q18_048860, partial [Sarracenia purpurea var. burkii]
RNPERDGNIRASELLRTELLDCHGDHPLSRRCRHPLIHHCERHRVVVDVVSVSTSII